MKIWEWFLVVGGGIVFTAGVIKAMIDIVVWFRNGRKNSSKYFEVKVLEIISEQQKIEESKIQYIMKTSTQEIKNFITSELDPIKENIKCIHASNTDLRHSIMVDLKIKLRSLYHDVFEEKGVLTKLEKSRWDKWYSSYQELGGNSDIKKMDEHIQKVHLEIIIDRQKSKASNIKRKPKKESMKNEN